MHPSDGSGFAAYGFDALIVWKRNSMMRVRALKGLCGKIFTIAVGVQVCLTLVLLPKAQASNNALPGSAYSSAWRNTGPSGGDVRALVVDPNDPNRFYFGTLDGQIYTSTD